MVAGVDLVELTREQRRTLLRLLDRAWADTNGLREQARPNSYEEDALLVHQQDLEAIMAKLR